MVLGLAEARPTPLGTGEAETLLLGSGEADFPSQGWVRLFRNP
jgi:hypothetical protein